MPVKRKGDFVFIQSTSVRISEILSAKPQSIVTFDYNGNVLQKDFNKILVTTNQGTQQFLYSPDNSEERDADLRELHEIIGSYQSQTSLDRGATTINVTSSTGVNIVSNSSNVQISQKEVNEAKGILTEMKLELQKMIDIESDLKEDIENIITEIEDQLKIQEKVKRHTFRSLLGLTSDFASLGGLAVSLGQVLSYL